MKIKTSGFTLIELLVVLSIIGMLVTILMPSITLVKNSVKETKQKAQFAAIEQALLAFKADYGDYPPSTYPDFIPPPPRTDYCGAQKLVEALLGWDMVGFHPASMWRANGCDAANNPIYNAANTTNMQQRKGPYLDSSAVDVFNIGNSASGEGLYLNTAPLLPERPVFTDVFKVRPITIPNTSQRVKAGSPILYYKANTASKVMSDIINPEMSIYDVRHNLPILGLNRLQKDGQISTLAADVHPMSQDPLGDNSYANFYRFESDGGIRDSKLAGNPAAPPWPHKPDSFILISAGVDGLFGTPDDIRNF